MQSLRIVILVFCLLPLITGALDMLLGGQALKKLGSRVAPEALADPTLDNQVRFWGAVWLGFGLLLAYAAIDLDQQALLFRLLCGVLFLSGIGRVLSMVKVGRPPVAFILAAAVELIGAPAVAIWHAALV